MSSTSSSERDWDEHWQYETEHNKNHRKAFGRNPFYSSIGHPLIYYAQVPQPISLKHQSRDRQRGSPNCFVKAFRWYTEEHVPNKSVSPNTDPNSTGFATWLDTKYDQFLLENQRDSDLYHIRIKKTSVIEAEKISKNASCEPCGTKRFRVKSPWKKKRRAKSSETGDGVRQKSNQSFKYIMQPKELARPTSECCHPSNATGLSECTNKALAESQSFSNMTLVKSKEPVPIQEKLKPSRSECQNCTNQHIDRKTSINEKMFVVNKATTHDFECQFGETKDSNVNAATQYDVKDSAMTLENGSTYYRSEIIEECGCQILDKKPLKPVTVNKTVSENNTNTVKCGCQVQSLDKMPQKPVHKTKSVSNYCQCPEEKVAIVDAESQSEPYPTNILHNTGCACDFKEFMRCYPPPVQSTSKCSNQCCCERTGKGLLRTGCKPVVKFSQNTAQTSNHSICLDKETVHEYPLFMKIVCADKLK